MIRTENLQKIFRTEEVETYEVYDVYFLNEEDLSIYPERQRTRLRKGCHQVNIAIR